MLNSLLMSQMGPMSQLAAPAGASPAQLMPSKAELELQELLAQAAQGTQSAQATSASSLQEYQQAEAQPAQQVSPTADALSTTLARLGTTLSGKDYATDSREAITAKNKQMSGERDANLKRLRTTYETAAKRAEEMGDHEAEIKARSAMSKLDKEAADRRQEDSQNFTAEQNRIRAAADKEEGRLKAIADKKKADGKPDIKPGDNLAAMNTLTDNIRQDKDLGDYMVIREQVTMGRDGMNSKNSAGDIMLIRALARASDPRTGIKEAEFNTFEGASGKLAKLMKGATTGMVGKGTLTEFGRKALMKELNGLEKRKGVQAGRSYKRFQNQVAKVKGWGFDLDEETILQNYKSEEDAAGAVETEAGGAPPQAPAYWPKMTPDEQAMWKKLHP